MALIRSEIDMRSIFNWKFFIQLMLIELSDGYLSQTVCTLKKRN